MSRPAFQEASGGHALVGSTSRSRSPRREEARAEDGEPADLGRRAGGACGRPKVVALFPGSFSPIQRSHMRVAALAMEAVAAHREPRLQLDSVALSLTNDGYGKRGLWPAADRARLANLALREAGLERAVVDEWEIQQDGFQQTHQVAQHFQETFRDAGEDRMLLLLAGADLVEGIFAQEVTPSIPKPWTAESVGKLLSHIDGFIVIARHGSKPWTPDSVRGCLRGKLAGTEFAARAEKMVVIMAPSDAGGGSSTQVRKLVGEGLQTEEAKQQLADLVGVAVQEDILHNIDFFRSLS